MTDNHSRIPGNYRKGWHFEIDNRARTHYGAVADPRAGDQHRTGANPHIVSEHHIGRLYCKTRCAMSCWCCHRCIGQYDLMGKKTVAANAYISIRGHDDADERRIVANMHLPRRTELEETAVIDAA